MATRPSTDGANIAAGPDIRAGDGTCRIIRAGVVDYREAWDWQVRIAEGVRAGAEPETLLLLEHPHTYTRGRLAPDSDLLLDDAALAAQGIAVVETDRGGLITYHGPGQLVAYPIIRLRSGSLTKQSLTKQSLTKQRGGPHWYVRTLERVIISVLAEFGLEAATIEGRTGVWTSDGQRKIAAIGVKIAGGVAYHGFAINVDPDLAMFDGIIPCGIADRAVTSLAVELGRAVDLNAAADSVARKFCEELGLLS